MSLRDARTRRAQTSSSGGGGLLRRRGGGAAMRGSAAANNNNNDDDHVARTPATRQPQQQQQSSSSSTDGAQGSVSPVAAVPSMLTTANATSSFALLDDDASFVVRGTSPMPTQLTQLPAASQDADVGNHHHHNNNNNSNNNHVTSTTLRSLPRQRPRFHTVQDLDMALNQAIEGKINRKNAWASKEASDLLEGIAHTIAHTLEAHSADDYSGFAKAATVVEGCSKVWTVRVDSTYTQSNRMVQRLLRNDDDDVAAAAAADTNDNDNDNDGNDGNDGDGDAAAAQRRRRQAARARAGRPLARTLAMEASEIDLDARARAALTQTGAVRAQFRAVTEKFDQGNAHGLLTHNAPLGVAGNFILDVDYARCSSSDNNSDNNSSDKTTDANNADTSAAPEAAMQPQPTQAVCARDDGLDVAVSADFVDTLPPYDLPQMLQTLVPHDAAQLPPLPPSSSLLSRPAMAATESVGGDAVVDAGSMATATSLASLLMLAPLTATTTATSAGAQAPLRRGSGGSGETSVTATTAIAVDNNNDNGVASTAVAATSHATDAQQRYDDNAGGDDDDTTWPAYDDDNDNDDNDAYAAGNDDDDDSSMQAMSRYSHHASTGHDDDDAAQRGDVARALVTGAAELDAMDALLATTTSSSSTTQLALEADDAGAWCVLSDVLPPHATALRDAAPRSELSRLHRQHRLAAGAATAYSHDHHNKSDGTAACDDGGSSDASRKRSRKASTVVFVLPPDVTSNNNNNKSNNKNSNNMSDGSNKSNALKQSASVGKHMTPLGKSLLLGRDAARLLLTYTQGGAVQRARAERAGLLLAPTPVPGVSLPAYMPSPVTITSFFQPFATRRAEWNMLRKSASGHLLTRDRAGRLLPAVTLSRNAAAATHMPPPPSHHARAASLHGSGRLSGDDATAAGTGDGNDLDMPVEFFPTGAGMRGHDAAHDDDGGGGGDGDGDYYDAADDGGGDGYDDVVAHANRQLLEHFDALHGQVVQATRGSGSRDDDNSRHTTGPSSARVSGADVARAAATAAAVARLSTGDNNNNYSSSVDEAAALTTEQMTALLHVLHGADVTMPSQIDVVGLRDVMWRILQQLLHLPHNNNSTATHTATAGEAEWCSGNAPHTSAATTTTATATQSREHDAVSTMAASAQRRRAAAGPLLKPHVSAALAHARAQTHHTTTTETTTTSSTAGTNTTTTTTGAGSKRARDDVDEAASTTTTTTSHKRTRKDDDVRDEAGEQAMTAATTVTHFSDVVHATLPFVRHVSSAGTLSPAFFFFCILFMANEHNLCLESVASLDDLVVNGVLAAAAAPPRASS